MKGVILSYLLVGFGCLGSLKRPVIGLYVYIFFAVLRPKFLWGWAAGLDNLSDYVGTAMLIGWAIHGFGTWRMKRGRAPVILFCFFFVWSALSAYFALNTAVAYPPILELSKILLPFLVGVSMLNTMQDARRVLWIMVGAQAYLSYELNLSYLVDGYNRVAVEGYALMDNNTFGISLVTTLGPAVALGLATRNWIARAAAGVGSLLILHTILLTFSRGAFMGLLAIGIMAFIVMPKRPKYIAVLLAVVLVTIRLTGPELAARYKSSFNERGEMDTSATERLELWERMFEVAFSRPVFGLGPANWPLVAHEYGFREGKIGHSVWVQGLVELGFPGIGALLFFYLVTVGALWRYSRQHRKVDRDATVIAAGIVLSIVGYAVSAQFVTLQHLEVPYYTVMCAVVILKSSLADAERARVVVPSQVVQGPMRIPPTAIPPAVTRAASAMNPNVTPGPKTARLPVRGL